MADAPKRVSMGNPLTGEVSEYLRADLIDMDLLRRVEAALAVYADGCDATETTHCGYEGNQCCKTAKDILTDLRAWMEKINE